MIKVAAFILAVLTVGVIIFALSYHPKSTAKAAGLVLGDLPMAYCPDQMWVIVVRADNQAILFDQATKIINCHQIVLPSTLPSTTLALYGKVPRSLAFTTILNWPMSEDIIIRPEVGDINGDNVIDALDQADVASNLFQAAGTGKSLLTDVDTDGTVTAIDWSLTQINKGVGEARPDRRAWSASVN